METVKKPKFSVFYEHKDIISYISPYVTSVSFTDNEHGQSDEIDLQIEDGEHRWKSSWYPTKGDSLRLYMGFEREPLISCGSFEIDEIEISAPPDIMNLKGISTSIKKTLRTKNSIAYENKTLVAIAKEIGKKHGFLVVGSEGFIRIGRITQNKEHDLTFLKRISESYGYIFKIANNKLVFYKLETLHSASSILEFDRKDLTSFNFKDKTNGIYKACEVSYFDPKTKKLITHTESRKDIKNGDTLKLNQRCENKEQAIHMAKAGLAGKIKEIEGNISLSGNPKLVAGANVSLTGLFKFSGKYHIKSAKHTIDKSSGYKTEIEVYKIA